MKKFLLIGSGAVGGFYAGKLAQTGAQVSLVSRSDFEVVKNHGIDVKSCFGDFHFTPHEVLKNSAQYQGKADFILVATKVLPEVNLHDIIAPALTPQTSIILLQNGIHIEKAVQKLFPNQHLISVLAFTCINRIAPGIIHHQDYGRLIIGDFPQGISAKTFELIELWKKSGVPVEVSEEIQKERWKKLVWNAAFNPISVIAGGINTAQILADEETRNLAENVMKEVCILAAADDCKLPENIVEKNIVMTEKMTPYKTSMLLDFEAKRKMEVEAILGNACRFAKSKNIATPYLARLYEDILNLSNYKK